MVFDAGDLATVAQAVAPCDDCVLLLFSARF
jgi:hypothetical protein